MVYRHWLFYFFAYASFTFVANVLDAVIAPATASDINTSLGNDVVGLSVGSTFLGIPVPNIGFLIEWVPKLVAFNYNFLQGDLEVVRWFLLLVFGGALIVNLVLTFLGVITSARN